MLKVSDELKFQQFDSIRLEMAKNFTVLIYALERGSEILAMADIWITKPKAVTIRPEDAFADVFIEKKVKESSFNCNPDLNAGYYGT